MGTPNEMEIETLRRTPIFSSLADEQRGGLLRVVRRTRFAKNQTIVAPSELSDPIGIVERGRIRAGIESPSGKFLWIDHDAGPGHLFVEDPASDVPLVAQALDDVTMLFFERVDLMEMVAHHAEALAALAHWEQERERKFRWATAEQAFSAVKARIGHKLAELARRNPDHQIPGLTNEDLAEMVCTTRPQATIYLGELKRDGYIDFKEGAHTGSITVLKIEELEAFDT
jgi:CRP/FNR family cyclic AMP-dependent transcriptional regulator